MSEENDTRDTNERPSAATAGSALWVTREHDERRKTFRWRDCTVNLRVLLNGDNGRTPLVEIMGDKPSVKIGPRGGKSMPSRWVDGCLLPQCSTIQAAAMAAEAWWDQWLKTRNQQPSSHD